jgi:P-type Cu2+ transporter
MNTGSLAPFARQDGSGAYRLMMLVDGVHCAGCISRVEKCARDFAGVIDARLNFSTRRLVVRWHGGPELADQIGAALTQMGYVPHAFDDENNQGEDKEAKQLLFALGISGFAAGNIMLLSFALWMTNVDTMGPAMRDFMHWMSAIIAIPAVMVSGQPFFISAFRALRRGRTNMDVPISVGLILTLAMSLFEILHHGEHAYFDSAVMLVFFLLIGRYLDALVRARARGAAGQLLEMMNKTATILMDGQQRVIPIKQIARDMMVLVAVGERLSADGVIVSGTSEIDMSMVNGETTPVPVSVGAAVISGTLNMSGPLTIKVTRDADTSFMSDMIRLMETAERGQAQYVRLADAAARLYTPVVHILALAAFLGWVFWGGMAWQGALLIASTVLIITCPCALGLAVPVVQVRAISHLMRRGVLVKSGDALEKLARIDTIVFDKTGTLTLGSPILVNPDTYAAEDLSLAASMAVQSKHPLSQGLAQSYRGEIRPLMVDEVVGQGLHASGPDGEMRLGKAEFVGVTPQQNEQGMSLYFKAPGRAPVTFNFQDALRPETSSVISALQMAGIQVHMLSGDRQEKAQQLATELGITQVRAECSPQDKYTCVQGLTQAGHKVWMIGDGLNDAPVLSAAYVSMSPSSAIEVTQVAADIIWTGSSLGPVAETLRVAKVAQTLVRQNFVMAIVYNALAMSSSSLMVVANAYRLRGK